LFHLREHILHILFPLISLMPAEKQIICGNLFHLREHILYILFPLASPMPAEKQINLR
jgi:hypothetical protein